MGKSGTCSNRGSREKPGNVHIPRAGKKDEAGAVRWTESRTGGAPTARVQRQQASSLIARRQGEGFGGGGPSKGGIERWPEKLSSAVEQHLNAAKNEITSMGTQKEKKPNSQQHCAVDGRNPVNCINHVRPITQENERILHALRTEW